VKCSECNNHDLYVDAEKDMLWCKSCGHNEQVDYADINNVYPMMKCGHRANALDNVVGEPLCSRPECVGTDNGYDEVDEA
jgi:hypothetical protein